MSKIFDKPLIDLYFFISFTSVFFVAETVSGIKLTYPILLLGLSGFTILKIKARDLIGAFIWFFSIFIFSFLPFILGSGDGVWVAQLGTSLLLFNLIAAILSSGTKLPISAILGFLVLLFFYFAALNYGGGRFRYGFGPNMMYRFIIFFTIILFISYQFLGPSWLQLATLFLGLFFSFIIIWSIGSRGGILLYTLILSFPFLFVRSKFKALLVGIFILVFVLLFIKNYELLRTIFGRLILFDLTNNSESHRFSQYVLFLEYLANVDVFNLFLGSGVGAYPYDAIYPHSWFLEAFVYYGGIFTCLLVAVFFKSWYSCIRLGMNFHRLWLLFSLPAFLSGSLFDNHYALAFWIVFSTNYKTLKRSVDAYPISN